MYCHHHCHCIRILGNSHIGKWLEMLQYLGLGNQDIVLRIASINQIHHMPTSHISMNCPTYPIDINIHNHSSHRSHSLSNNNYKYNRNNSYSRYNSCSCSNLLNSRNNCSNNSSNNYCINNNNNYKNNNYINLHNRINNNSINRFNNKFRKYKHQLNNPQHWYFLEINQMNCNL